MASYQAETGFQLFSRLSTRPNLLNIYPEILPNCPNPKEVIEITGGTSAGKTILITELIAKCILPQQQDTIQIDGKNAGAILINTDHHFHIFKLIRIMENLLKNCCKQFTKQFSNTQITDIINNSLKNLIVLNCFDSQQLFITINNLDNLLTNHSNISMLVLDSLSAYYWADRLNGGIQKIDFYQKTILKLIQNVTKDYHLVIVFTKYISFVSKREMVEKCVLLPTLEKINYRIVLEKLKHEENQFLAKITTPGNNIVHKTYKINDLIEWSDL